MMSFLSGSPFDVDVEKATSEKSTAEDWSLIMEICDKIGNSSQHARDCLRSIMKRLNAQDPHIVILAITLLDACSSNCGKVFHLEIASRDFENQFIKLLSNSRSQPKIYEKLKSLLRKWADGDFKTDPQLNLIPSLYQKLKSEGHDFSASMETPRPSYAMCKDPNVVTSNKEEEEIAKAIELSLQESSKQSTISHHSSPSSKKTTSLYPNVNSALVTSANLEGRKVKALYDFEAVEDNELTFSAGEIIHILDDSDPNWWKGSTQRGEGLFPSNFVTADLTIEPEQFTKLESNNKKSVQFAEEVEVKTVKREPEVVEVEIDEQKMDRLLHILLEADPQSGATDSSEMIDLEEQVNAMGPLIDTALEKVDKQHSILTQLSSDLVEAMNLYHTLMREPAISSYTLPKMPPQQMVYPFGHPQAGHPQMGHPHVGPLQMAQGGHPQPGHPQIGGHPGHPQAAHAHPQVAHQVPHSQAGHPHSGHPQPGHALPGHPQSAHPGHPQPGHPHPGHPQPGHPHPGHPQPGHPHPGHPQHVHVIPGHPHPGHMQPGHPALNGVGPVAGMEEFVNMYRVGPAISNMPGANVTLPHNFQTPAGLKQMHSEEHPESQQSNQNNIPYIHQGMLMYRNRLAAQSGIPGPHLSQMPSGQPISNPQQPQFAPPNGQRIL